jgi:ubiquitin-conjugating enzyme E2 D/E
MGSYTVNEKIEKERNDFLRYKNTICCEGNPEKGDYVWNIIMDGPLDSPYMGGKFKIRITFETDYPKSKPTFEFMTPICHININERHICLDSLDNYNEKSTILNSLSQIFMMLTSPNETSAYSKYKDLYIKHYGDYLRKAREMTREYAKI